MLIILDYLVIDFVQRNHSMTSNELKSAISSYDLLEKAPLQKQIDKIVETFVNPKI